MSRPTVRRPVVTLVLTIAWVCVVLVGYYRLHKPITFAQANTAGCAVLDILLAALTTTLAGGIGHRLLSARTCHPLERATLQVGLGWGVLALFWFALGSLALFHRWVAWLVLGAGWLLLTRDNLGWLDQLRSLRSLVPAGDRLTVVLALGNGALVGGQLLVALAPPTKWDALVYHLELPRRYLSAGRFIFVSENPFWGHPQVAEMIYTWAAALRGWETAAVFGWAFGICLLIGVLGLAARWTNPRGGWVAVTALLTGLTFRGMLAWSYQDSLVTLYGWAALTALLYSVSTGQRRWILWAGCFVGLSVSTKLTSALLIAALVATPYLNHQSNARRWRQGGLFAALIALAVFSPWLLKNVLATGNPLYPHGWETAWTPVERLAYYRGTGQAVAWRDLWLPLAITWDGVEGAPGFAADIGPLLTVLVVPGLANRLRDQAGRIVLLWLGLGWVAMVVGELYSAYLAQTRLYFALLPAAALAAAWGWQNLEGITFAGVRLWRIAAVAVLAVLSLSLWQDAVLQTRLNPAGVISGTRSAEQYIDDSLGWYGPVMRALHELPAGSRVLFLWEPRSFYAPPDAQADSWLDRWYLDRRSLGSPQAILQAWKGAGFTHILVYQAGAQFEHDNQPALKPADWEALDALLAGLARSIDFAGTYQLYRLRVFQ